MLNLKEPVEYLPYLNKYRTQSKHNKDVNDLVIGVETIYPLRDDGCNKVQLLDCKAEC